METVISVVGLGYVGLPVAVEFGKKFKVIGFDINQQRIDELKKGVDRTKEVETADLQSTRVHYTSSIEDLKQANFHIVAVPTPVNEAKQPDMSILVAASKTVGKALKKGDIVVYESTVYPGATEEDCLPVLEQVSGLRGGVDFKIGYSPERINPGDKEHRFATITKVVSGQDEESLNKIAETYAAVVKAGVYRAETIKVAEAAKVIENTQRDLNVAFMNELSIIFSNMGIDTQSVLAAARTKWNFLPFTPGLVGGHCIGVDPFYLTYKSEKMGYHPQVILAGRRINDNMGKYVAQRTVEQMILAGIHVAKACVNVIGLTFKENCPDLRNSRVVDIIAELERMHIKVNIADPEADPVEVEHEFKKKTVAFNDLPQADAVIVAAPHRELIEKEQKLVDMMKEPKIFMDVRGAFKDFPKRHKNVRYWRL